MRYFDSSALVKLILEERESAELHDYAFRDVRIFSSGLARTEVVRAVGRSSPSLSSTAADLVQRIELLPVTHDVLDSAGRLQPATLRSLDAIHLASALLIREELEAFVAYDARLLDAAASLGLPIAFPGA